MGKDDKDSAKAEDVEAQASVAEAALTTVMSSDAEVVEEYAASAMDNLFGYVNDTFGEKITTLFLGEGGEEEEEADTDVIMLLATLALSKLGITLSVGIDWSFFEDAFGWLSNISVLTIGVPDVDPDVVSKIVFAALLLVQPACLARMYWLSLEHQKAFPEFFQFLKYVVRLDMNPFGPIFSPLCLLLLISSVLIFIPAIAVKANLVAGSAFVFLFLPSLYIAAVNYGRYRIWQYVDLRCADAVKRRQYENLCMQEGSLMLFLFVAAYAFVTNFFFEIFASWDDGDHPESETAYITVGFLAYAIIPLYVIYAIINDQNADRTFRMFRLQLVSPFTDEGMYMKIALLLENMFFSLAVVVIGGSDEVGQLAWGFTIAVLSFAVSAYVRPYQDDMEFYTDVVARGCSTATLFLGIIIAASSKGSVSNEAVSVFLILISCFGTGWFLYTLDIKDMLLNRFFLIMQLYAQSKATRYNEKYIRTMPAAAIRAMTKSPIELHVLSAVQKINFATLRKNDFFCGNCVKELSDLGITWLDLQQVGWDAMSLQSLGFTAEELMKVDAQLDNMGDRSDIQKLFEKSYADTVAAAEGNEDSRDVLSAKHQLGMFYQDMGDHKRALEMMQQCYEKRKELFGESDADTLASQLYIGDYMLTLSRPGVALEMLTSCLALHDAREKEDDYDPEARLKCLRGIGKAQQKLGMSKDAVETLKTVLNTTIANAKEEKLREDHPITLSARLDYAEALVDCGRRTAVEKLKLNAIMNRQKTIHGVDSPETHALMDRYVELLTKLGKHKDSLQQNLEVVSEKAATLGPQHPGTVKSTFTLAATYIELGKIRELKELRLEDILADQEQRLTKTHPTTITSVVKLAAIYQSLGRYEDALALFQRCYDVRQVSLGLEHELTLGIANNIAIVLDTMGKYEEALKMYEDTCDVHIRTQGETSVNTLGVMLNLGQIYQRIGNLPKAEEYYRRVQKIAHETYGAHHPRSLLATNFMACLWLVQEKHADAHALYEDCLKNEIQTFDESHPYVLTTMENLALCKIHLQNSAGAMSLYERVCHIRSVNYGDLNMDTLKAKLGYAAALAEMRRGPEALSMLNKLIKDATTVLGTKHQHFVYECMGIQGHAYALMGNNHEALLYTQRAIDGVTALFGADHFQTQKLTAKKVWLLNAMGRHAEAAMCSGQPQQEAAVDENVTSPLQEQQEKVNEVMQMNQQQQAEKINALLMQFQTELNNATMTLQTGNFPEAIGQYQSIFSNREYPMLFMTAYGPQLAPHMRQAQLNYCMALMQCQQFPAAVPTLENLIEESVQQVGPEPDDIVIGAKNMLAQAYGNMGQLAKGVELFNDVFDYFYKKTGASENTINAISTRALYRYHLDDLDGAMEDYRLSQKLLAEHQGADHPDTAQSLAQIQQLFAAKNVNFTME